MGPRQGLPLLQGLKKRKGCHRVPRQLSFLKPRPWLDNRTQPSRGCQVAAGGAEPQRLALHRLEVELTAGAPESVPKWTRSSGAWVPLPPWPHRSASLLLLHFLLTYQIEMGLLYKNLPENIMYERHTLHVFLF